MATFRCKRSGNLVSFNNPDDIAGLRKHEGYEEVHDAVQQKTDEAIKTPEAAQEVKKRGRPKKIEDLVI